MAIRLLALVLALLSVCTLAGCDDLSADANIVRDCWSSYIARCNEFDGEKTAELLSDASFARYDNLKKLALEGESNQIKVLSNWDQLEVLYMRAGLKRSQLMKMDGRAYVIHAVKEGWWGMENASVELDTVKIRKDVASAKVKDSVGDVTVEFVREDGQWKLDQPASDRYFNDFLSRIATRMNITGTDLSVRLIEMEFGPQDEKKLFSPMR